MIGTRTTCAGAVPADGLSIRPLERFLEAMRPATMGPRLAAALGGPRTAWHVLDAQFEPGVRAVVLYARGEELVRGDLLPDPAAEPSALVVAPGVRLSRFPVDPGLPTLPRVMNPDLLGAALAAAVDGSSYGSARRAPRCRADLVRYRPGRRATLLVARCGDPGRYVVKAYHDDAKAAAVASEASVLAGAASASTTLALAPVVTHLRHLRAVVQRAVPGAPLDALLGTRSGATAVAGAGHALAELHGIESATDRQRPVVTELRRFRLRAAGIATVDARAGEALGVLTERLAATYGELTPDRPGAVHGDCTPSQFRYGPRCTYVTDLDHLGLADQAVDVGTFLASLRQRDIRRGLSRSTPRTTAPIGALAATFLAAYQEVRGGPLEPPRVTWHEAAALARKALRAFARAPRSPLPLALAASATRCLDGLDREEGW